MAVEEVTVQRSDLRYEELAEFIYSLRQSGFRAGPHQYTSAHRLLINLAAQEPLQNNPRRLVTYLAPVLCSSPKEQADFYRLFEQWLSHRLPDVAENEPDAARPEGLRPDLPAVEHDSTPRWRAWLRVLQSRRAWFITLVFAIAAATVIFLVLRNRPYTLSGQVFETETTSPVTNAEVNFAGQSKLTDEAGKFSFTYKSRELTPNIEVSHDKYLPATPVAVGTGRAQEITLYLTPAPTPIIPIDKLPASSSTEPSPSITPTATATATATASQTVSPPVQLRKFDSLYYFLILAGAVLLLFLLYGLWRIWRIFRLRQLERWRTDKKIELLNINVKGVGNHLYQGAVFRRLAQELRRHRRLKSNTLDVVQTVAATASEGGIFTPVYGSRLLTPEYLVLVDRHNFRDQKAQLEDEIVGRLKREGVFIDRYYFNADPRVCQTKEPRLAYRTLEELATRHPDHRLLVFSDGSWFIDPLSGRPHQWLEQFSSWPIRVLLTPEPDWGYREWLLAQAGWAVRPAREQGLLTLMEIMRTGEVPKGYQHPSKASDYPELLLQRPERWLEEKTPDEETLEELHVQLRYYLGSEGYYLLSACAVYPQLLWGFTFYFTYHLVGQKRHEETLEALVRLPWLRHGFMPDWLRATLISRLPATRETDIRQTLEKLLVSHLENPRDGFAIEIAPTPVKTEESFWRKQLKRLKQKVDELRWRKFFRDVIRTEPEGGPLRDYVFLNFMSGSKLAVMLPRNLRRLLYRQGQPILGLHPVRALVIPAVLSVVASLSLLALPPEIFGGNASDLTPDELAQMVPPVPVPPTLPDTIPTPTPPVIDPTRKTGEAPELAQAQKVFLVQLPSVVRNPSIVLYIIASDLTTRTLNITIRNPTSGSQTTSVVYRPAMMDITSMPTRITLQPGDNQITVADPQRPNDARYKATASVKYDNSTSNQARLNITLLDTDRKPIRNGIVRVLNSIRQTLMSVRYTGQRLALIIPSASAPFGTYQINVIAEGHKAQGRFVTLRSGSTTTLEMTLEPEPPPPPPPTGSTTGTPTSTPTSTPAFTPRTTPRATPAPTVEPKRLSPAASPTPDSTPDSRQSITSVEVSLTIRKAVEITRAAENTDARFITTLAGSEMGGSTITAEILLDGKKVGDDQFVIELRPQPTNYSLKISLGKLVRSSMCGRMSIQVRGKFIGIGDVGIARLSVSGLLSDGGSMPLLQTNEFIISDKDSGRRFVFSCSPQS